MSTKDSNSSSPAEVVASCAIPLFDGPSKQAAVLLLESCGINVVQTADGFAIRNGKRGWRTKTLEGTLREAIDAYRLEGPKSVVFVNWFRLQVASALAGTEDEKPYRDLTACYADAVDMIEIVKRKSVVEAVQMADLGTPIGPNPRTQVIQFPNREKK